MKKLKTIQTIAQLSINAIKLYPLKTVKYVKYKYIIPSNMKFKKTSLLIISFLLLSHTYPTFGQESFTPSEITLRGTTDGKTIELNWDADNGSAPYGYRILWSLIPSPTYPLGENDYYDTVRQEEIDTYTVDYFLNTGTYYVRICVLDGKDNCLNYSNENNFLIEKIAEEEEPSNENSEQTETDQTEEDNRSEDQLPEEIESEVPLTDIQQHRNRDAIKYLYQNQIISGYPDLTFRPDTTVNRAELMKILVGGQGKNPDPNQFKNCFPDVSEEWFAPYICYAKTAGWVSGYPDEEFKPGREVNKAETIKMLINSRGLPIPESIEEDIYVDVSATQWFATYIKVAKEKGLLEEIGSMYNPEKAMTRAGISENIYRAMYMEQNGLDKFENPKT